MTSAGKQRAMPPTLQSALQQEQSAGLFSRQLLVDFKRQALRMRAWMHEQLQSLGAQGFRIVAYGAAAKGMVLLHYLQQLQPRSYDFDFIADDAALKQGTYCPGTSIPVLPASHLSHTPTSQPLAIVIMPWNFLEEITRRIRNILHSPRAPVILVVPFPQQRLLQLYSSLPPTDISSTTHTPLLSQDPAQALASVSSEGFAAGMRAANADAANGLHNAVDFNAVGVASDVLQQAQAARF